MLSNGDTIAVFQMESPGLRKIIRRLKYEIIWRYCSPTFFIYRPGPLQSGMVDDSQIKKMATKIKYPDNSLEHIFKRNLWSYSLSRTSYENCKFYGYLFFRWSRSSEELWEKKILL